MVASSATVSTSVSPVVEQYNYDIVRKFTIMALVWGVLGMTAGVWIASELARSEEHTSELQSH